MGANTINGDRITAGTLHATKIIAGSISGTEISATAIDGKTITGAYIRTDSGGNRMQMRDDGVAGVIEFFTGIAGESAPGYLNPTLVAGVLPAVQIYSGTTSTYNQRAGIIVQSGNNSSDSTRITLAAKRIDIGTAGLTDVINFNAMPSMPGFPKQIEYATVTVTVTTSNVGTQSVSWSNAFATTPEVVVVSPIGANASFYHAYVVSANAGGCTVGCRHVDNVSTSNSIDVTIIAANYV
jgi:hypothetical protein